MNETTRIERADRLPLLITWMQQMHIASNIDQNWQTHRAWEGLSFGQLTVLFIAFRVQQRDHRLSFFDDRLGILLHTLGADADRLHRFHHQHGQHLIQADALPTEVARYDTTSFNVSYAPPGPGMSDHALLRFGFSKDHRPDVLQFKQALGTLDPAGVPLISHTLPGNRSDDSLYLPVWREFVQVLGHRDFLFVGDAKAASLATRATIAHEGGTYLMPLPMTGAVPTLLRQWVVRPPTAIRPLHLPTSNTDATPRDVGKGFVTWRTMRTTLDDGTVVTWRERWLVTHSPTHAQRQKERLHQRLKRAEAALQKLRPKAGERAADVQTRAMTILKQQQVVGLLRVHVQETAVTQRRSGKRGRPAADTPITEVTRWHITMDIQRNDEAVALEERVAGWRVYVTNTRQNQLTHAQALAYYRDQWIAEHGSHRFKEGAIPVLPLLVRVPQRIIGLLVARRSLADQHTEIASLMPGNPKMKTARPTAERLLAALGNLHLLVQ